MNKDLLLVPIMSEKTYGLSKVNNVFTFKVPISSNVTQIADAVAAQYGVTVESVRTLRQNGKVVRTIRKAARPGYGKRVDYKKAYVTLAAGQTIPVFAAIDEAAEAESKAAEKADKKAKKAEAK